MCTDKDLSTIASKLEKWEPISSHLSITNAEVIEIKNNHQGDYRQQKTRALQLWKAKVGKAATYKCLVDVIQAIVGESFAEDICEMAVDTYHGMSFYVCVYLLVCSTICSVQSFPWINYNMISQFC